MALTYKLTDIKNYKEVCFMWTAPDPVTEPAYETVAEAVKDGWGVDMVREHEGKVQVRRQNPITKAIIMGTLACDIGDLNEKNLPEFYARFMTLQALDGGYVLKPDGPYMLTYEDIAAHVGLRTNASFSPMPRTKWATHHIAKGRMEELHRSAKYKIEKEAK